MQIHWFNLFSKTRIFFSSFHKKSLRNIVFSDEMLERPLFVLERPFWAKVHCLITCGNRRSVNVPFLSFTMEPLCTQLEKAIKVLSFRCFWQWLLIQLSDPRFYTSEKGIVSLELPKIGLVHLPQNKISFSLQFLIKTFFE